MAFGDMLLRLDPTALRSDEDAVEETLEAAAGGDQLAFVAPTSGRFYSRPSPDEQPFVTVGDVVQSGQVVAIVEVMKTFTELQYGGAKATVVRVVPSDGDDLESGDTILELTPC